MDESFTKEERLCSKKIIQNLFEKGSSFVIYPFRIFWFETELETRYSVQILINVSKKSFPNAVDRNKIKRQIREVYRKNKNILYEHLDNKGKQYALSFIYTAKDKAGFKEMETKIILSLQRLIKEIEV
ncbi:MAG: ribonuclease P protein component [Bacteroidota bacterium]